ncbi:aldehyde dehydrogenase family protein [Actinoplanes sp. NBRC 101535]|uniref:aldehyde dehydrogenase family protein n=1 Tax=Actinoplanes sp. NBRC 101535 TaxID=3032196 RepID=UPI0024A5EFB7|nr:aldehyde dehydrogenase family protein [Actinoplanes sp. NBRC 101535]GLY02393.1 sorbosone dehydrogenase [Actinoplanes sp. NBRC 101535]
MTTFETQHWPNLIGGKALDGSGSAAERISPGHAQIAARYVSASKADVDAAVAAARREFDTGSWPRMSGAERAAVLRRVASRIEQEVDALALIETVESGKPISQARDEVRGAAGIWHYAAGLAQQTYGDAHNALGEGFLAMVVKEPVGVVGVITPWNFPLLIVSQKLPFALAAGCTTVIKPSDMTPGTTTRLVQILHEEGLPPGAANLVHGGGDVGQWLAEHPGTDMTTFTGSTRVGKSVARAAADSLKKVSLELGGKNPQVVFADADLDAALEKVVFGAYFNQGECCNAGSRLLVHQDVAEEFTQRVVQRTHDVVVGDPLDEATKVGALISEHHLGVVTDYVALGEREGATIATGGQRLDAPVGRYFQPTVLTGVPKAARVAREEIFGPVLSVVTFSDLAEAVEITNATGYGLSAGVWSRDIGTAMSYAQATRAGTVWVNCYMEGFPEVCFGGYGASGIGRELGRTACDEFSEQKSIVVRTGAPLPKWVN